MRYFLLLSVLLLFSCIGCKKKQDLAVRSEVLDEIGTLIEIPETKTLFFPDFGIYITNWPKHWVLANHGNGCNSWDNSTGFIFGSPNETIGSVQIERADNLEADYFSTFEVTKREVWNDKKNVDLDLETVDGGKVKLKFLNLKKKHEKWVIENVAFLPPFEETAIEEVTFPSFPIFAPKKDQKIDMLLGFNVLTSSRDYQISFRNQTSRLGVSCTLRNKVKGSVSVFFKKSNQEFKIGDVITLEAKEENVVWKILRKEDKFVVTETEKKQTKTLYEIPISKDYDFTFYAEED
ncbi:hypothetical protein [uncultured Croceitalea sp.]|uniref:hypothetical protein n=1 Tax=uncultured Croceitalea sp. TaxID=1798908 RepID=UPI0033063F22